ncbi:FecR family protein [Pontibacter pamirensis]|uniref:FecR family protein n=1 Tax=Pontibacter pamirensis TaxID=2562824 RepID=UPI001389F617|nr:FecR family protein [Pontibacter pamirensis]
MNKDLLDRFYAGECSPEEVQEVLKWFHKSSLNTEHEQELNDMWQKASQLTDDKLQHDSESIFKEIKAKIQEPQKPEEEETGTITRFLQLQPPQFWLKVAAAVFLPICLAFVLVQYTSSSGKKAAAYMSVAAAPGVKKTIKLSDGSVIRLNAGSSVSFRKSFAADKREIQLRGEAFFEVAKDSLRPFIVHTGNISTQALGTSFNINYSVHNAAITVALATGVVKIDRQEQEGKRQLTQLVPGQQLSYNKASQQYNVAAFDRNEVLGWKQGVLVFRRADLGQIVRKLETWYGVDIEVDAQDIQDTAWNYTGEYNNEKLESVLEGIGFVKGFSYKQKGSKIKIVFNQTQKHMSEEKE